MTATQKVVIATVLAAAIITGIYEAYQASRARVFASTFQQQAAALNEQIRELTRERDDAIRGLSAPSGEADRLNRGASELLKLRGEVSRLTAAANDPTLAAAQTWLGRVSELKQYLEQHPEGKIPELKLMDEDDWLKATVNAYAARPDVSDDYTYRRTFGYLHNAAKSKFAWMASNALKSYAMTRDPRFPTEVSELKVYFNEPINDDILKRYGIFPTSHFASTRIRAAGEWVLAEISTPGLSERYFIHAGGWNIIKLADKGK